jgi:hydroxymethylbilane synthase
MRNAKIQFIALGTRSSDLALIQANQVSWVLQRENVELSVKIKEIVTSGDKILDSPLAKIGDKGLFVKEIENELLAEDIDVAVHSCKDLPTELPAGLIIAAYGEREDPRDVFIGSAGNLDEIPEGARIGTSSLRRKSQLLALRPDLDVVDIRGNVNTRIRKIEEAGLHGTLLAAAGVKRLEREEDIGFYFSEEEIVPAVGQGIIALECRESDNTVRQILSGYNNDNAAAEAIAERALLHELEGGCQVPIGAHARADGDKLVMNAFLGSLDGRRTVRMNKSGPVDRPVDLGVELAGEMRSAGGDSILEEVRDAADASTGDS